MAILSSREDLTLDDKTEDLAVLTKQLKTSALQTLKNTDFSPIPSIEGGGEQRRVSENINGLQVNITESLNNLRYPSLDIEIVNDSSANNSFLLLRTDPQGEISYALPDDGIYSKIGLSKNEFAQLLITGLDNISRKNSEELDVDQVSTTAIVGEQVKTLEVGTNDSVTLITENETTELTQETLVTNSLPSVTENSAMDLLVEVSAPVIIQSDQVESVPTTSLPVVSKNAWIESLKSQIDNIDSSKLQIFSGVSKVYEQNNNEITLNNLENALGQKVQQALENPTQLQGSVRILIDGEKIYHAKGGEVLENRYSLALERQQVTLGSSPEIVTEVSQVIETKEQNIQLNQSIAELDFAISPEVEVASSVSLPPQKLVVPVKNEQIDSAFTQKAQPTKLEAREKAIFELIARQEVRLNHLEQKLAAVTQTRLHNPKINNWLGALNQTAKEAVKEVKARSLHIPQNVRQFLANKSNQIQSSIKEQVKTTRGEVVSKVNEVKSSFQRQLADVAGKTLNASTRYLAERFGEDNGAGIKVFQGNSLIITSSSEHSGIYSKDGKQLVRDGEIISSVTSEQLSKIAQVPTEAQKLNQAETQVRAKALR